MKNRKLVAALSDQFDHEDFDRLLEESSLSTATARKNQTETPIEVYMRVQDHLRGSEGACRQGDVDDFLFHLVRLCSASSDTEPTSSALVNTAFSPRFWMLRRHVRADSVPGIVQTLLDNEVFSYLRQDVARSMVSLCFNSRTSLPLVVLNACASAVPASSFRDELADAFTNMMPAEWIVLPAGSWMKRLDEPDAIYHAEPQAGRQTQQVLVMTRPGKGVDVTAQFPRPEGRRSATNLLSGACDGDRRAWEEIVRRYSGMVLTKVRSFRLQDADALNAVQMTWLRLAENCHRIQFPDQLGGWLATTACRECLRILRHQAQHSPTPPDTVAQRAADPSVGPEQNTVDADTTQRLWDLVATLAPRRQTLIRELFINNPRPYAEVARDTGIPTDGIGSTRARALTQLRRRLQERGLIADHRKLVGAQDHDNEIHKVVWSPDDQLLATVRSCAELVSSSGSAPADDDIIKLQLTPQELQVSRTIQRGLTNANAATALFLSVKTIEYHLSSIYRKLGISSRTQLIRVLSAGRTT